MNLKIYPALKFLLLMLSGLISTLISPQVFFAVLIISISLQILIIIKKNNFIRSLYYPAAVLCGFLLSFSLDKQIDTPEKITPEFRAVFQGRVEKILKSENNYLRFIAAGSLDSRIYKKTEKTRLLISAYLKNDDSGKIERGCNIYSVLKVRIPESANLPTDFPEKEYCSSQGIDFIARTVDGSLSIIARSGLFDIVVNSIRNNINKKNDRIFSRRNRGFVKAIALGDKSSLTYMQRDLFVFSGTAHVMAVSGLHVGLIAFIIYTLLFFLKNKFLKLILLAAALFFYVIITGIQPSAVRAAIMVLLYLYVKALQRKPEPVNIIALTLILSLFYDVNLIRSAAFQMSAISILGITLLYLPVRNFFLSFFKTEKSIIKNIINSISVTIAATIVISPLTAYYFGNFSVISPVMNLPVIPLMILGLIYSYMALLISFLFPALGILFAHSADMMFDLSVYLNYLAADFPYSHFSGSNVFIMSLLISSALLMIFTGKGIKQLMIRSSLSIAGILIIIFIINKNKKVKTFQIYPRKKYVAVIETPADGIKNVCLIDRKPASYPLADYSMIKYLSEMPDSIIININGNNGQSIFDEVVENRYAAYKRIDNNYVKLLQKKLGLKEPLPKIICKGKYDK